MDITEASILHHVGIVLVLLWILSYFGLCYPIVYFISFIYIFQVHERYALKLRRRLHFKEKKQANQKRLLSDSETVRWLNHAIEKVWPVCMEQIASKKVLLPIIPWFLDKYKPWTVSKAVVQELYLGRNPPIFTEVRAVRESADDDHLVLELGMSFLSADDMSAVLAVKLRKRLGFGMWANMHITGMHVEGKVLVGVRFLGKWPFLERLRVCFAEPPYFQMTVKPIFNHGIDVTEIPGIAGWLDKLLAVAFEQTLVEPNVLVVDMTKFASSSAEPWFSMDEKCPLAFVKVEVVEASDMKPSDLNGLADPYVKGQLGPYRFRTKVQKKTLNPKWQEEFRIPISSWEASNVLELEVRDKDTFVDDVLGKCSVNICDHRDGRRHDLWLPLHDVNVGRLHLAITVVDLAAKEGENSNDESIPNKKVHMDSKVEVGENAQKAPQERPLKMADEFEPINVEGQKQIGTVFVHHPGSEVSQTWEPRKRNGRHPDTLIHRVDINSNDSPGSVSSRAHDKSCSSDDENPEGKKLHPLQTIRKSIRKLASLFSRSSKNESPSNRDEPLLSPPTNIKPVHGKGTGLKYATENYNSGSLEELKTDTEVTSPKNEVNNDSKSGHMKGMAKSILNKAGKSAHNMKHAIGRRSKGRSGLDTERDHQEPSCSDDESSLTSSKEFSPSVGESAKDFPSPQGSGYESTLPTPSKEPSVNVLQDSSLTENQENIEKKTSFRCKDEIIDEANENVTHEMIDKECVSSKASLLETDRLVDDTVEVGVSSFSKEKGVDGSMQVGK